jgi:hypothetical protein
MAGNLSMLVAFEVELHGDKVTVERHFLDVSSIFLRIRQN